MTLTWVRPRGAGATLVWVAHQVPSQLDACERVGVAGSILSTTGRHGMESFRTTFTSCHRRQSSHREENQGQVIIVCMGPVPHLSVRACAKKWTKLRGNDCPALGPETMACLVWGMRVGLRGFYPQVALIGHRFGPRYPLLLQPLRQSRIHRHRETAQHCEAWTCLAWPGWMDVGLEDRPACCTTTALPCFVFSFPFVEDS